MVPHLPSVLNSAGIYLGQPIGAALGSVLIHAAPAAQRCDVCAGIAIVAAALQARIVALGTPPPRGGSVGLGNGNGGSRTSFGDR